MLEHHLSDQAPTRDGAQASERLAAARFAATALEHHGETVIRVAGELDLAAAPELDRLLGEADPTRPVVVDLTDCEFIDSSGLLILVRHSQRMRGFALVCTPGDATSQLLELTGFVGRRAGHGVPLRVFSSREEAHRALDRAAQRWSRTGSLILASRRSVAATGAPPARHPPAV
jgi:anti-anti-sigma factor